MAGKTGKHSRGMDWLGLVSFGFFFILIGAIWFISPPALHEEIRDFVKSENWILQPVIGNLSLPMPTRAYPATYTAAMQFCFAFGVFEIVILALRLALHDPMERLTGAISGMAFWLSVGYFLSLLANESIGWFAFLAGIIISAGLAIVASSIAKLIA
jgi:hypothetical protein